MKVAIVGTAPGWDRAPWQDPEWEIWGLNDAYRLFGPDQICTRWFELHGDTPLTRARRPVDHFTRIAAMDIPVYYLHGDPPARQAVQVDADRLAKQGRDYFACTTAYQIALALEMGATAIRLCGTPLQANREAVVERPCVAWWLGLAEGRGVTVTVEHDNPSGLLRHPYRYAAEDWDERLSAYAEAQMLHWSLDTWLPREAERLELVEMFDAR